MCLNNNVIQIERNNILLDLCGQCIYSVHMNKETKSSKKQSKRMIVASITLPNELLVQIKDRTASQDLSMSQYIRRLARADLAIREEA